MQILFSLSNKEGAELTIHDEVVKDEGDTSTAENRKLCPMCLTKDASSSATVDSGKI